MNVNPGNAEQVFSILVYGLILLMVLRILDVHSLLHEHRNLRMPKKQKDNTFFRPGKPLDKWEFIALLINHIQLLPFVVSNIPYSYGIPQYFQAIGMNSMFTELNSRCIGTSQFQSATECLSKEWCVWDREGTILLSDTLNNTEWTERCIVGYNETNPNRYKKFYGGLNIKLPGSLFSSRFMVIWFLGFLCGVISIFLPFLSWALHRSHRQGKKNRGSFGNSITKASIP